MNTAEEKIPPIPDEAASKAHQNILRIARSSWQATLIALVGSAFTSSAFKAADSRMLNLIAAGFWSLVLVYGAVAGIYAIIRGSAKPHRACLRHAIIGTVINIALIASAFVVFNSARSRAAANRIGGQKLLNSMEQDLRHFEKSLDSSDGLTTVPAPPAADGTARASGSMGQLQRIVHGQMSAMITCQNNYRLELQAIGWDSVLDSADMKSDSWIENRKTMITKARLAHDKYRDCVSRVREDTRTAMTKAAMSDKERAAVLKGFDEAQVKVRPQQDQMFDLERQIIDEVEAIILLVESNKNWTLKGDILDLGNDEANERWTAHYTKIQQLGEQQEALQRANIENARRSIDASKKAAGK